MFFSSLVNRLITLLFPDCCIICGRVMGHVKSRLCICQRCANKLTFLDEVPTCCICGAPLSDNEKICVICQTHRQNFDRAISCFAYKDGPREAILRFKFRGKRELCRPFAAILCKRIKPIHKKTPFDLILYTPLSNLAYKERGYNQAELLARQLAKELTLPIIKSAFCKVKETPKQSTLPVSRRTKNLKNAFRLAVSADAIRDKRIILVDDVLTTGATANALSELLEQAGAKYILVATIATTESKRQNNFSQADMEEITF